MNDDSTIGGRRSEVGGRTEGCHLPAFSSTLHPPPSTVSSALRPPPSTVSSALLPSPHPRSLRRAFTLVEMLVVIGIFGLLMGVTMNIFEGIGKGAKMRAAMMELKSSLSLARQYAITDWNSVFVVFPDPSLDFSNDPSLTNSCYQSYYICNRTWTNIVDSDGKWKTRYLQGKLAVWHHLPRGVIFDKGHAPTKPKYANVFDPSVRDSVHNLPFPPPPDASFFTQACVAIAFHPNGRLLDGYEGDGEFITPQIFVTEGIAEPTYVLYPNATVYGIEVRPYTGRIKITELTPP